MTKPVDGPELLEIARGFRPRIVAERDRIEAGRRLPDDLARDLASDGFFGIFLPAAYGGLDLAPADALAIFEELARAAASVAWCVWNGNTHWTAAQLSPKAAGAIYAGPHAITANSTRSSGQAHLVPGGYRVSGRWSLVSGCELAAWRCCYASSMRTGNRALPPQVLPKFASCCCRSVTARSSTPVCAAVPVRQR